MIAGDTILVDGAQHTDIRVTTVGSGYGIVPANGGAPIDPPDLPNDPAPEPDAPEPDAIPEGQTGEPLAPLPAEASGCSAAKDGSGLAPWAIGLGLGVVVARRRRNRA
jgi:uncharacterized protein (TIGR03382 family)